VARVDTTTEVVTVRRYPNSTAVFPAGRGNISFIHSTRRGPSARRKKRATKKSRSAESAAPVAWSTPPTVETAPLPSAPRSAPSISLIPWGRRSATCEANGWRDWGSRPMIPPNPSW